MNRKFLLFIALCASTLTFAQAPAGYYSKADGKSGQTLRTALEGIISSHTDVGYGSGKKPGDIHNGCWGAYLITDLRADGKIWDMYSSTTNFTPVTDQAGNYSKEGDVYNREHSFPKSWFGDKNATTIMGHDLYHVVPTDGYVNNRRGNYPFGEVATITYQSNGGFSKLGTATAELKANGYTSGDPVFEPNDMYKGDFARNYFYMLTCYASKVKSWPSGSSGQTFANGDFTAWQAKLLIKWSKEDPVDQKERDRIEAVYSLQKNRNPFIDCPGLEEYIWGDLKTTPVSIAVLTGIAGVPGEQTSNMNINVESGVVNLEVLKDNTHINIYNITGQAVINITLNKGTYNYSLPQGMYIISGKKVLIN